jgi:hypothetical protein
VPPSTPACLRAARRLSAGCAGPRVAGRRGSALPGRDAVRGQLRHLWLRARLPRADMGAPLCFACGGDAREPPPAGERRRALYVCVDLHFLGSHLAAPRRAPALPRHGTAAAARGAARAACARRSSAAAAGLRQRGCVTRQPLLTRPVSCRCRGGHLGHPPSLCEHERRPRCRGQDQVS